MIVCRRSRGTIWLGIILAAALGGCRGRPATEVETAWRQVRAEPDSAQAHLALGKAYAGADQHNDAYTQYKQALELDPNSFEATYEVAHACLSLLDPQTGRRWIDRALEIEPNSARAFELRGRINIMARKPDAGITDFHKAIRLDPSLTVAYLNLVAAYKTLGDNDAALEAAATAVRLAPRQATAHFAYGDVLELTGDEEQAEQEYRAALELQDDLASAKLRLAMLLASQKRHLQEARELAKAAQWLDAGDGTAEALAAWILILMGEETEGLIELEQAARAHPFNQTIWFRFARALKDAGHDEVAEKAAAMGWRVAPRRAALPENRTTLPPAVSPGN